MPPRYAVVAVALAIAGCGADPGGEPGRLTPRGTASTRTVTPAHSPTASGTPSAGLVGLVVDTLPGFTPASKPGGEQLSLPRAVLAVNGGQPSPSLQSLFAAAGFKRGFVRVFNGSSGVLAVVALQFTPAGAETAFRTGLLPTLEHVGGTHFPVPGVSSGVGTSVATGGKTYLAVSFRTGANAYHVVLAVTGAATGAHQAAVIAAAKRQQEKG
jgi:hypothetical protein